MKQTITIDGKMEEPPKSIKTLKGVFFWSLINIRSLFGHSESTKQSTTSVFTSV